VEIHSSGCVRAINSEHRPNDIATQHPDTNPAKEKNKKEIRSKGPMATANSPPADMDRARV